MSALDAIPDLLPQDTSNPDDVASLPAKGLPPAPSTKPVSPLPSLGTLFAPSSSVGGAGALTPDASATPSPLPTPPSPAAGPLGPAGGPLTAAGPLGSLAPVTAPDLAATPLPGAPAPTLTATASPAKPEGFLGHLESVLPALMPLIATASLARGGNPLAMSAGTTGLMAGLLQGKMLQQQRQAQFLMQQVQVARLNEQISNDQADRALKYLEYVRSGDQLRQTFQGHALDELLKIAQDPTLMSQPQLFYAAAGALDQQGQTIGMDPGSILKVAGQLRPQGENAVAFQKAAQALWTRISTLYKANLDDPKFLDSEIPAPADLALAMHEPVGTLVPLRMIAAANGILATKSGAVVTPAKPVKPIDTQALQDAYDAFTEKNGRPPTAAERKQIDLQVARSLKTQVLIGSTPAAPVVPGSPEYRVAQDLAYGKLTFAQFRTLYAYSRDANTRTAIYQKAAELNPNFNPAQFEMGFQFAKQPKIQQQLASLDNVVRATPDLISFSNEAARTGVTALNRMVQKGGYLVGGQQYSNFRTAVQAYADELSGALGYGSATDMSRQMGFNMTDPNLSPANFAAAMNNVVIPFIARKRQTMLDQMGIYGQPGMNPAAKNAAAEAGAGEIPNVPGAGGPRAAPKVGDIMLLNGKRVRITAILPGGKAQVTPVP